MHLTAANGPMVAPGSQRLCDSLTGYALGSLEHIIVLTGELYICTNPKQLNKTKQPKLFLEAFLKKKKNQHRAMSVLCHPINITLQAMH